MGTSCPHPWGIWAPNCHVLRAHSPGTLRDAPVDVLSAKHIPACSHYTAPTPAYAPGAHHIHRSPDTVLLPSFSPRSRLSHEVFQLPANLRVFLLPLMHRTYGLCLSSGMHHILPCNSLLWDFYWLWTVSLGWHLTVCLVFPVGTWPVFTGTFNAGVDCAPPQGLVNIGWIGSWMAYGTALLHPKTGAWFSQQKPCFPWFTWLLMNLSLSSQFAWHLMTLSIT